MLMSIVHTIKSYLYAHVRLYDSRAGTEPYVPSFRVLPIRIRCIPEAVGYVNFFQFYFYLLAGSEFVLR